MTNFEKVKEFMTTFGQEVKTSAEFPENKIVELRKKLIDEEFNELKNIAISKGFLLVSSSPLTRSSYHAGDDFARLKVARQKQLERV